MRVVITKLYFCSYSPGADGSLSEWAIIELQGDLTARGTEDLSHQFIGDLYYNKYGQPIMIIGHHMLTGREQKVEKPYAVLEKSKTNEGENLTDTVADVSTLNATVDQTLLDTTAAIENKSAQRTEYKVRAIITKKIIFKARPKPIIANVPDNV